MPSLKPSQEVAYLPVRWVEGELLQFAEGSPVTQGARLGFMWASPGQRRFLVCPRPISNMMSVSGRRP